MAFFHQFGFLSIYAIVCVFQLCSAHSDFQLKALNLHNQFRARHHSPPLQLDERLNDVATRCAGYYAGRRVIDHSCPFKQNMGENLFLGVGTGNTWSDRRVAEQSANDFYNEVKHYNFKNGGFSKQTGHFTQLVWKNSERFGFGYARNGDIAVGVALYTPQGNIQQRFRENVLIAF